MLSHDKLWFVSYNDECILAKTVTVLFIEDTFK